MESKTNGKIKKFVKKNPYPSYDFVGDMILSKAKKWKDEGVMEFKFHYLMMNSEYGLNNHNLLKEIYENIEGEELVRRNGEEINNSGGYQAMAYNSYAFAEILKYLIGEKAKTKFEQNELYYKMKLQQENCWDGVGEWHI